MKETQVCWLKASRKLFKQGSSDVKFTAKKKIVSLAKSVMSGFSTLTLYLLVTGQGVQFFFSWKKKNNTKEKGVRMQTLISIL